MGSSKEWASVVRLAPGTELALAAASATPRARRDRGAGPAAPDAFGRRLRADAPPRARVERVTVTVLDEGPARDADGLVRHRGQRHVTSADACSRRHRDLRRLPARATRPADRRVPLYVHQLHNCGPRATIIEELPYDARRPRCASSRVRACEAETRPPDRRFSPASPVPPGPEPLWHPTGTPAPWRTARRRSAPADGASHGGRRGQGARRLPPRLRRDGCWRRAAAARPQAPLGEAVRDHGRGPRSRRGAVPPRCRGAEAADRPHAAHRAARGASRRVAVACPGGGGGQPPAGRVPALHAAPPPAAGEVGAHRAHIRQPYRRAAGDDDGDALARHAGLADGFLPDREIRPATTIGDPGGGRGESVVRRAALRAGPAAAAGRDAHAPAGRWPESKHTFTLAPAPGARSRRTTATSKTSRPTRVHGQGPTSPRLLAQEPGRRPRPPPEYLSRSTPSTAPARSRIAVQPITPRRVVRREHGLEGRSWASPTTAWALATTAPSGATAAANLRVQRWPGSAGAAARRRAGRDGPYRMALGYLLVAEAPPATA